MVKRMPGRTRVVDGSGQLSLLDEAPAPGAGREVSPDRGRLRLNGVPVGELLRESGDLAPLVAAEFLDGLEWGAFEPAYAGTGRAPYSPRAMVGEASPHVRNDVRVRRRRTRGAKRDTPF